MKEILPYIVVGIGVFLFMLGSLGSMKRKRILESVVEDRTYEIISCNGTSLVLEANDSLCIDLRKLNVRYLGKGDYIEEKDVYFPLIKGNKGKLSLKIESHCVSLNITKEFIDGGYLIPVEEGLWNITIKSENPSILCDIVEDIPKDARITKNGNITRIPCGDYSVLLYNPSEDPVSIKVYSSEGLNSLPLIALGLAVFLLGISLRRREYAHRDWRGRGRENSVRSLN